MKKEVCSHFHILQESYSMIFFKPIMYLCVLLADISGSPVSMDVGTCRSHCGGAYRTSDDRTQQDFLKYSSMLEFLRSKKVSRPCSFKNRHKGALLPHYCSRRHTNEIYYFVDI